MLNLTGVLVGLGSFLIIGVLHPVVIKVEYYWGKEAWPAFLAGGILCCTASVLVSNAALSSLLAVLGFSLFWSIRELYEQEQRVQKGWHPRNEKRAARRKKLEQI